MSGDFDSMYSRLGRASVPPERLLKSLLLISLYSIRSERAFQELDYNLLYRWILYMDLMEPSFDATGTTENRRRVLRHKVGRTLFEDIAYEADRRGLFQANTSAGRVCSSRPQDPSRFSEDALPNAVTMAALRPLVRMSRLTAKVEAESRSSNPRLAY